MTLKDKKTGFMFQDEIRHPSKLIIDKKQYAYRENMLTGKT